MEYDFDATLALVGIDPPCLREKLGCHLLETADDHHNKLGTFTAMVDAVLPISSFHFACDRPVKLSFFSRLKHRHACILYQVFLTFEPEIINFFRIAAY
jgi:hypothetical protein